MTNEQYYELIRPYEDVSRIMMTKLDILNHSITTKISVNRSTIPSIGLRPRRVSKGN